MERSKTDDAGLEREVFVSMADGGLGGRGWFFVIAALAAGAPAAVEGQAGRAGTREGNRLYEEGRFAEAHEKYLEALLEAPDSPIIRFNDGNALYQGENYESALESFRAAVESGDPQLAAAAWYNLGNTLYRQDALPESLEAFKQALRAAPGDLDAKHNLERVLEQMQEQEQQQQQQGDGEDDPQDQESDPEQPEQDPGRNPQDQPNPEDSEQPPETDTPPPGQMTREEAERLLGAIQEDQDEVNRKPRTPVRGTRPRRDW